MKVKFITPAGNESEKDVKRVEITTTHIIVDDELFSRQDLDYTSTSTNRRFSSAEIEESAPAKATPHSTPLPSVAVKPANK